MKPCHSCKTPTSNPKYCSNKCQQKFQEKEFPLLKTDASRKRRLLQAHSMACDICKTAIWNNQPITLELDHIDGNHLNNNKVNLRLICPNCHSQTPTYKNKNKGKGRPQRRGAMPKNQT